MPRNPADSRRDWTVTAWSCLGAVLVTTLLFVTIYDTRGTHPEARQPREAQAIARMDHSNALADARHARQRSARLGEPD